ncbi:hypothetical protein EMCRGX_G015068 [Ephydatia muelleri]
MRIGCNAYHHLYLFWLWNAMSVIARRLSIPVQMLQFFFAFNYSKAGRSPAGLSLNPASQAWTSVLAWYTGHLVCGQRYSLVPPQLGIGKCNTSLWDTLALQLLPNLSTSVCCA